ncbi:hypothetical protein [Lentzea kentuckyensis]|uniref:hypothetical protein n=1 Tax=Lentzea kentuckyensis TaxID=360086 RepID=UPI000A3B9C5A|nr:hypothetical protein [Lentzea kentuckyensis]
MRFWHLEPRDEDLPLLHAHMGDAALTFTGHGLRIGQMTLALPGHINIIEINGRNGDVRA